MRCAEVRSSQSENLINKNSHVIETVFIDQAIAVLKTPFVFILMRTAICRLAIRKFKLLAFSSAFVWP